MAGPRERSCWSWSADQIRLQQRSCEHNAVSLGEGMVRWSGATPDRPVVWDGCTGKARSRRERRTWQPVMPICRGRGGRSERAAKAVSSRAALWRKYWAPPFRSSSTEVPRARTSRSAPVGQQDLRHSATHQEPSGASLITIARRNAHYAIITQLGGTPPHAASKGGQVQFPPRPPRIRLSFRDVDDGRSASPAADQGTRPAVRLLSLRVCVVCLRDACHIHRTLLLCGPRGGGGVHIASRGDALSAPP